MQDAVAYMNALHGKGTVEIEIADSYHNMKEVLTEHPDAVNTARKAMRNLGITAVSDPIRAELSLRGLPCPNLGNGDRNCHGRYEFVVTEELEKSSELIREIVKMIVEG